MPYPATVTYWLEATELAQTGLRRYTRGGTGLTCQEGYHSALVLTGQKDAVFTERDGRRILYLDTPEPAPHDDPRWPTRCDTCDYVFAEDDQWQDWQDLLYRRSDTGDLVTLRDAPPGASWDAWWLPNSWAGPDGIHLMVRCPNGHDWHVDGQARNCTRPGEPHQCWVRHGDPRDCHVTVDKAGDTCAAGAGSILAGDYHGFLHDGTLTAG